MSAKYVLVQLPLFDSGDNQLISLCDCISSFSEPVIITMVTITIWILTALFCAIIHVECRPKSSENVEVINYCLSTHI